jgi:hypothetical protein
MVWTRAVQRIALPATSMLLLAGLPLAGARPALASASSGAGATVTLSLHNDTSLPLRDLAQTPPPPGGTAVRPLRRPTRSRPHLSQSHAHAGATPSLSTNAAVPGPSVNFDGVGNGVRGFKVTGAPPDPNGAVGPNHYVQLVNTDLEVFAKDGTSLLGPAAISSLWSGFGGLCQADDDGDPIVLYDRLADRWLISQFALTGANGGSVPFEECVAVSVTGDPTGAYNRYSFPDKNFPDYPKLSVWPDAYYLTVNDFTPDGNSIVGVRAAALDRAHMLAGQPATQQSFLDTTDLIAGMLPSDVDSSVPPPAGAPNHLVALGDTFGFGTPQLSTWNFHVDWATPTRSTFTGPVNLKTDPFTEPCFSFNGSCVPQPGTGPQLDAIGDRVMFRYAYRNFGDHESLVVSHTVEIGGGSSVGVRWYELRLSGQTPSIFQHGTYAPDASFRWMPSIAMDRAGDIGLGYSVSSDTLHPSIRFTGRLAADPPGTMAVGEATLFTGTGSQTTITSENLPLTRWGDYTDMTVDPSDGCTFWYTNEYIPSDGVLNWRTRIGSFRFPACGGGGGGDDFSIVANPGTLNVARGSQAQVTIASAVTSGSPTAVTLSAAGLPAGVTASFAPDPVQSGGTSTLTVAAGPGAALGPAALVVMGTGAGHSHTANIALTVISANSVSVEAEVPGNVLAGGARVIKCAACSGGARVGHMGRGASLTFENVTVPSAGTYQLVIAYTNGAGTRSANMIVDGGAPVTLDFASTRGFGTVGTLTVTVTLAAGANTIRFTNPTASAPDFDRIMVSG